MSIYPLHIFCYIRFHYIPFHHGLNINHAKTQGVDIVEARSDGICTNQFWVVFTKYLPTELYYNFLFFVINFNHQKERNLLVEFQGCFLTCFFHLLKHISIDDFDSVYVCNYL